MRKLLILVIVCGCSMLCKAQKGIYLDSTYADGTKAVQTLYHTYTNLLDDPSVLVGLTEFSNKNSSHLQFNVQICRSYVLGAIPKNGRLLIKYDKDSVLELRAVARCESKRIRNQYLLIASYPISSSDILKLKKSVNKIRLETILENITLDIDPRLSQEAITSAERALINHNNKNGNDNFKDNF